jgi:uncharacterized protein
MNSKGNAFARLIAQCWMPFILLAMSCPSYADDPPKPAYPNYPSETPDKFTPVTDSYDYTLRDVMIAMRDGVKLHTVILIPKGVTHAAILFTRTPYNAKELTKPPPQRPSRPHARGL